MKTLTINKAGKRRTAYTTETVSTFISLSGYKVTRITVKEALELSKGLPVYQSGVNYTTFKLKGDDMVLTTFKERLSKYGLPYYSARWWFFEDDLGNKGKLRAVTEMEALYRLREAFDYAGCISWISESDFNKNE